jgi:hypothetical protein
MKGFKFEPVKWGATIVALVIAAMSVPEFVNILPENVRGWVLIGIAVAVRLGVPAIRSKTTPLAAPEDAEGRQLVPRS